MTDTNTLNCPDCGKRGWACRCHRRPDVANHPPLLPSMRVPGRTAADYGIKPSPLVPVTEECDLCGAATPASPLTPAGARRATSVLP